LWCKFNKKKKKLTFAKYCFIIPMSGGNIIGTGCTTWNAKIKANDKTPGRKQATGARVRMAYK
jgi:hypothetical protein